jgi:hypothetical protein
MRGGAGLAKVETVFVLVTQRRMGRGDHLREKSCRSERQNHTKYCHHTAHLSRPDTMGKTLKDSGSEPKNAHNPPGLDEVGTRKQKERRDLPRRSQRRN